MAFLLNARKSPAQLNNSIDPEYQQRMLAFRTNDSTTLKDDQGVDVVIPAGTLFLPQNLFLITDLTNPVIPTTTEVTPEDVATWLSNFASVLPSTMNVFGVGALNASQNSYDKGLSSYYLIFTETDVDNIPVKMLEMITPFQF